MPEIRGGLPHLLVSRTATAELYTTPKLGRGPSLNLPPRNRQNMPKVFIKTCQLHGDGVPPEEFSCKQCGNCCLNLNAHQSCATEEDVALWEENGRDDILEWVDEMIPGVHDIWIHPQTGEDVSRCPWLRKLPRQEKYVCHIHDMKPEMCRNYPLSRQHAGETGCKGVG